MTDAELKRLHRTHEELCREVDAMRRELQVLQTRHDMLVQMLRDADKLPKLSVNDTLWWRGE